MWKAGVQNAQLSHQKQGYTFSPIYGLGNKSPSVNRERWLFWLKPPHAIFLRGNSSIKIVLMVH